MSRDLTGKTLGGYRFGEVLARGAQSTVYEAHQGESDSPVAIKVFLTELPKDKASPIITEVQRATSLQHKNLVPVLEVGSLEWKGKKHLFVVMQRLHGESLRSRLASQPGHALPLHVALQIAGSIGGALHAIHGAGAVHRGVNAGAVFISPPTDEERAQDIEAEDHVYLLDLGASSFQDGLSGSSGSQGRRARQDDIRGLAALLSEMLGGSPATVAQGSEALLPLRYRNRKIPARLDAVLRLVLSDKLSPDKQEPFSSMAELMAALLGDAQSIPTLAAWSSDGREEAPKTRGRSGLLWAALLSIVGGASFGIGYWLYQDPGPSQPVPAVSSQASSAAAADMAHSDAAHSDHSEVK